MDGSVRLSKSHASGLRSRVDGAVSIGAQNLISYHSPKPRDPPSLSNDRNQFICGNPAPYFVLTRAN